jgi:hypothetical protein
MVELSDRKQWFKISNPPKGKRILFDSKHPCYVICFTKKSTSEIREINVQQSDYVYEWNKQEVENRRNTKKFKVKLMIKKIPILSKACKIIIYYPRSLFWLIKIKLKRKQEKKRRAYSLQKLFNL